MIRGLKDLFPSYLDGDNISNHCSIIDTQDNIVERKISLLSTWNNLRRPILFERVQVEDYVATVRVHVNTDSPIRSVKGTRDFNSISEEYDEEELVTTGVFEVTVTDTLPIFLIMGTVSVETYDDTVYTKGYPEYDTRHGSPHDHDKFLDLVGKLLNIPRRIYKQISFTPSYYKNTYPPYFVKYSPEVPYWTEDDYYYFARLKKFCDGLSVTNDIAGLMADVLYEWRDASVVGCNNRTTYLYPEYEEIAGEETHFNLLVTPYKRYSNIDYSNMQQVISQYTSITRLLFLITEKYAGYLIQNTAYTMTSFPQGKLSFNAYAEYEDHDLEVYDIDYAQYRITYYNPHLESKTSNVVTADANNQCSSNKLFSIADYPFVKIYLRRAYEIKGKNVTDEKIYYLPSMREIPAWENVQKIFVESSNDANFDLTRWTGNPDTGGTTRSITEENKLNLGRNNNSYSANYPDGDWAELLHIKIIEDTTATSTSNYIATIIYRNTNDGYLRFRINKNYTISIVENDTVVSTLASFVDATHTENTLSIERRANSITFTYYDVNGNKVSHTRTYTTITSVGLLAIRTYEAFDVELGLDSRYKLPDTPLPPVTRLDTSMTIANVTATVGDTATITIEVEDENGEAVDEGTVTVNITENTP